MLGALIVYIPVKANLISDVTYEITLAGTIVFGSSDAVIIHGYFYGEYGGGGS